MGAYKGLNYCYQVGPHTVRYNKYDYKVTAICTGEKGIKYVEATKMLIRKGNKYESEIEDYIIKIKLYELLMKQLGGKA